MASQHAQQPALPCAHQDNYFFQIFPLLRDPSGVWHLQGTRYWLRQSKSWLGVKREGTRFWRRQSKKLGVIFPLFRDHSRGVSRFKNSGGWSQCSQVVQARGKCSLPEQSLHNLNYGPVWQDICTGESREDAERKFARFTILSETGRERLNTPQFWDRDV